MQTRREFLVDSMVAGLSVGLASSLPLSAAATLRKPDEFVDFDALGMAELLRNREISRAEAVEIVIRRIEALDPILNVMTTKAYDRARANAETIPLESTFAGWPILIKDMIDVAGVRRTDGSRLMLTNVPTESVDYIDGVEAAGLNILGMTNVPEFAQLGLVTNNMAFGLTRNPWDLSSSAGGSSGGAAAAVAAGIVPMAHGTDGGGSNRFPACFCGLFGVKPSRGRMLPGEPESKHGPFKTNQVISRTVRDSAALFHETQDRNGPFEPVPPISRSSDRRPLRIGLAIDIEGAIPTETPVRDAQLSTASLLEELGHSVEEVRYPVDAEEFFEAHTNAFLRQFLVVAEAAESLSGFPAADSGLLDPFTASILTHAASISDEDAEAGMAFLDALPHKFAAAFEEVDLILSPVTPVASIAADALRPDQYFTNESRKFLEDRMSFCAPVNVVGNCAMSIPLNSARDTGLPVGSMLQAATGKDRLLYECALELEDARPWKDRWAPYSIRYIPV